jgi:AraC-like DNA-binding protein
MAMSELQSFQAARQSPTVSDHVNAAAMDIGVNERRKFGSETLEICRLDPSPEVVRTFGTGNLRLDLLKFAKDRSLELEFLMRSHLVIFLIDGVSKGCEWTDGHQTRTIRSLAPHAVVFNPAQKYLRIRAAVLTNNCDMLILTIQPRLTSWRNDLEIDLAAVPLQQKIGFNDHAACQSLIAMQQELEAPGINGAFYIDALLSLLLTRLMRCASNLAEPSKPTYTKGGLSNWRLKQAIELLEVHPAEMPTLAEVAELIGLHPTSFCRGFKQSTGLPPHRYMLVHRVNCAKKMMDDQRLSLTQIALDCGFGSSSQFSVVFKKITGMSPREYRHSI